VSDPKSHSTRPRRSAREREKARDHAREDAGAARGRSRSARADDDEEEPLDEEAAEELLRREAGEAGGFLPDLLRRGLTLGFTGVFMTEEAVRRALGDSVPRDLLEYFVAQSERTRAELLDRFSREFGRVLSSLDPAEVARRLLDGRTVELKASFRLVPDAPRDDGDRPPHRGRTPDDEDDDEEGGGSRSKREAR
jgi:hypothetical protein